MSVNNNPFDVKIVDVVMKKFGGAEPMSIMPQVTEFVLYQSIYSQILKAQLAIYDAINLLNNYPLVGEETIEVTLEQTNEDSTYVKDTYTLTFLISDVRNLDISRSGREQAYFLELQSVESYENSKCNMSMAYHDNIENIIESVLKDKLKTNKVYYPYESTKKVREIVIPLSHPFEAIKFLCRHAVAENTDKYSSFTFYEALDPVTRSSYFVFKPLQKYTHERSEDEAALQSSKNKPYFYVSNIEALRNNPTTMAALMSQGFTENRSILSLKYNKRYSTQEKLIGGYFDNEYVEINLLQKDFKITRTEINNPFTTLHSGLLNTNPYVDDVIPPNETKPPETTGRTKYVINSYDDENQPSRRDRFGKAARNFIAMSQIDMSVDILTNLSVAVGDLIYINIPETSGFNENDLDKYISGQFMISEIKTIVRPSGETSTLLRVNKDSYLNIIETKSRFNNGD